MALKPFSGELDQPSQVTLKPFSGELDKPIDESDSRMASLKQGWQDSLIGLAQLGEMIPGVPGLRNLIGKPFGLPPLGPKAASSLAQEKEEDYNASRAQDDRSGFDAYRLLGNVLQPVNYVFNLVPGAGQALSGTAAQKVWPAMKEAAKYGAKVGMGTSLMQPVTDAPTSDMAELAKQKVIQAMTGALAGGVMGGGMVAGARALGAAREGVRNLRLPWTKEGYKEIAIKSDIHNMPSSQVDDIVSTAAQAQPTIPGANVTVAEALQKPSARYPYGHPAGGTLQKTQEITYKTPGDPAYKGQRILEQSLTAQRAAEQELDTITAPLRNQALDAANASGKLTIAQPVKEIKALVRTAEVQGRPGTEKVLDGMIAWLKQRSNPYGQIDARTLYEFKKDGINEVVKNIYGKDDPSGSALFKARHLRQVQDIIDNAIKKAGGGSTWDDYLAKYHEGLSKIETERYMKGVQPAPPGAPVPYEQSPPGMYEPLQKVSSGYGVATPAANEIALKGPPLLNRYYAIAKWLPEQRARMLEPMIDSYRADMYGDAPTWAKAVTDVRNAEAGRKAIIDALIRRGLIPGSVAVGSATQSP